MKRNKSRLVKNHERGKCRAYDQIDNKETQKRVRSLTLLTVEYLDACHPVTLLEGAPFLWQLGPELWTIGRSVANLASRLGMAICPSHSFAFEEILKMRWLKTWSWTILSYRSSQAEDILIDHQLLWNIGNRIDKRESPSQDTGQLFCPRSGHASSYHFSLAGVLRLRRTRNRTRKVLER